MTEVSFFSKLKNDLTVRQLWSLVSVLFLQFAAFASLSVIAPFFPNEAAKKGMTESVSGLVFSIYALVLMVISSLVGKVLPFIGIRFTLIIGVFFVGVCNILFGLLNQVQSNNVFAILCFVVRSFEAFGAASMNTAACTYVMKMFPEFTTTAFGIIKTVIGIGLSVGPAIGAALYAVGGFRLPLFVLGSVVLLNAPICYFSVLPQTDSENGGDHVLARSTNRPLTYGRMFIIPGVVNACLVVFVISQNIGFLSPTLSTHLLNNNIKTEYSGIAFFIISTAYAVSSLVIGFWAAKSDKFLLTFLGLMFTAVGFVFIGPSYFIPLNTSLWLTCVAMAVIGVATSVAITPSFEVMLLHITDKGYTNDVNTYGLISGLWSSMWSLGDITGPAIGGLLAQHLGFPNSATIISALTAATAVSVVINFCCSKSKEEEEETLIDKTSNESKSDKQTRLANASMSEKYQKFKFENNINKLKKKETDTQKSYGTSI